MDTVEMVLIGGAVLALLAVAALMLNRSWGGSTGRTPAAYTVPPRTAGTPALEGMDEVIALLARGNKIAAIKRYRELTGVGLKEARDAVEAMEAGQAVADPVVPVTPEAFDEVRQLVRQGNKIAAIKRYRELTGVGLKEARDAVETL